MLRKSIISSVFLFLCLTVLAESGIYVGGHFRRNRPATVTNLKNSGFTYVILFNVNVEPNGDLTTDGDVICSGGKYVFDQKHPYYVDDVNALKTGITSITRLEYCIGGWGNESYFKITDLIKAQGTGTNSILYKNFKALKDAIPVVEAINNDDEHSYSGPNAVKFHAMLYDIGFYTTAAPYTNKDFWVGFITNLNKQRSGAVKKVYIQCYDGGKHNNPKDWHIDGVELHGGLMHFESSDSIKRQMTNWKNDADIKGGFLWVYNDESYSLKGHAKAINDVFGGGELAYMGELTPHITLYTENDYGGTSVNFQAGTYTPYGIEIQKFPVKSLSSVKLHEGFTLELYKTENQSDEPIKITQDIADISTLIDKNQIVSFKITPVLDNSIKDKSYYVKNRESGLWLSLAENSNKDGNFIQQKNMMGGSYQRWIPRVGKYGAYRLNNGRTGKVVQVLNATKEDDAQLVQKTYGSSEEENFHQEMMIQPNVGTDFHKLMMLHSLKYAMLVEDKENDLNSDLIQGALKTNLSSDWEFLLPQDAMTPHVVLYESCEYEGKKSNIQVGDYIASQLLDFGFGKNTLSSVKVTKGFKLTLYSEDNLAGEKLVLKENSSCLGDFDEKTVSLSVQADGVTGMKGAYSLQNRKSNLYLSLETESNENKIKLIQQAGSGSNFQKWRLADLGNGVYQIVNAKSGKAVELEEISSNCKIQQNEYTDIMKQKFVLIPGSAAGYYKLISLETLLVMDIDNTNSIIQTLNSDNLSSEWKLIETEDVAVNELADSEIIRLYPNPVSDILYVDSKSHTVSKVSIINSLGQEMLKLSENTNIIDVSRLSSGLYSVTLSFEGRDIPYQAKFVKR